MMTRHQLFVGLLRADCQAPTTAASCIQSWLLCMVGYKYPLNYASGRRLLKQAPAAGKLRL